MQRDDQQITTEPGLQCELSGAPLENIHQVCSESSKFLKEIESASKGLNINTVSIGFDPFNNLSDINGPDIYLWNNQDVIDKSRIKWTGSPPPSRDSLSEAVKHNDG